MVSRLGLALSISASVFLTINCQTISIPVIGLPCDTRVPPPSREGFVESGGASYFQIFRAQKINCSGHLSSWRFRSSTIDKVTRPLLTIWEQLEQNGTLAFTLVGTNNINEPPTLVQDDWYEYNVPDNEQIRIDSSRDLYIGIFYPKITQNNTALLIKYLDKFPKTGDYSDNPNSTIVGNLSWDDMFTLINLNNGIVPFDFQRMKFDMRLPYLQARVVEQPIYTFEMALPDAITEDDIEYFQFTSEPVSVLNPNYTDLFDTTSRRPRATTTASSTTTTSATTTTTTTTTSATSTTVRSTRTELYLPTVEPGIQAAAKDETICFGPPFLENARVSGNPPRGYLHEVVIFKCDIGFKMVGGSKVTCSGSGVWKGEGYCKVTSTACYIPKPRSGNCWGISKKWYFDMNSRSCRWFFYGGCDGNANRFNSQSECMGVCGFLAQPVQSFSFSYWPFNF